MMCLQSVQQPAELKHLTPAEEKKSIEISVVTASEPESQRPTRMVNKTAHLSEKWEVVRLI